jgi:hypothetical protein
MGQAFFTVYDTKSRPVAAKTLVDAAGNDVINPRTGQPLIVPRGYDVNAAIAFGRSLNNLSKLPFNEELAAQQILDTYKAMYKAFQEGGPQDLQRSYNGMVGGGGDEFVDAFRDAASYHLGIVGRAAGLGPDEIKLAGGLYNLWQRRKNPKIDTSGPLFNNPGNFKMIEEGIGGHDSGRFFQPSRKQGPGAGQLPSYAEKIDPNQPRDSTSWGQASLDEGLPQNPADFGAADPQAPNRQLARAGQAGASSQPGPAPNFGLPQHVIDTGKYLRANGIEITPRTMYVANVLGPRSAVDLFKRTGSTSSDAVPSPDAATGQQMRAWARQLRLGPAALAAPPAAPSFGPSNSPVPAAQPVWGNVGMPAQQQDMGEDRGPPMSDPPRPLV